MAKSIRGRATSTVAVIEAPVSYNFRRRARITFYVVAFTVGLLAAVVASHHLDPVLGLLAGFGIGIAVAIPVAAIVFAWPVLRVFIRWGAELGLAIALVWAWTAVNTATSLPIALLLILGLVGVPAAIGPSRRLILAWLLCLVVRHRLRLCFAAFIIANRQGSVPLILHARPTPAGERVWVWLRPGLSLADLDQRLDKLAVACWANQVRAVRASRTYAAFIRVDITRRNPLSADVASPLLDLVPDDPRHPAFAPSVDAPISPPTALDLPDIADPVDDEPAPRRGGRSRARRDNTDDRPARRFGEDNADWA